VEKIEERIKRKEKGKDIIKTYFNNKNPLRRSEGDFNIFFQSPTTKKWPLNTYYLTSINSTSKIKVAFGGIAPPAPRDPYPK